MYNTSGLLREEQIALPREVQGTIGHKFVRYVDGAHQLKKISPDLGPWAVRQHQIAGNAVAGDEDFASLETKFGGQTYRLAGAVLEEFRNSRLIHFRRPPLVYTQVYTHRGRRSTVLHPF